MTADSATPHPATAEDYLDVVTPAGPAAHPDGRVVFIQQGVDRAADRATSSLAIVDDAGIRPLTSGPADTAPAWNLATGRVVFVRPDAGGVPQLWEIDPAGGEAAALTSADRLPRGAGAPVVSPDGTRIAFAATVARSTVAPGAPVVSRTLRHRADGAGRRGDLRSHLFVLELRTGAITRLTDGDWDAVEPAWSPDGTRLAFTAGVDSDADTTLRTGVHVIDPADPVRPLRRVGRAASLRAPLTWISGDEILAVGTAEPGIRNAELLVLSLDADVPDRSLTADLDRNVMPGGVGYPGGRPTLTAGGDVLFCLREGGSTELHAIPLAGGPTRPLVAGSRRVVSGIASAGAVAWAVVATEDSFGELQRIDLATAAAETVTALGADLAERVAFPVTTECWFDLSDGSRVQGWMLRDPELTGPGPLVLDVHGGPHNAWTGVPSLMQPHHADLVRRGYTVLMVNPRGSDGYGQAFFDGVHDAWADADLPDLMEPVEVLIVEGIADPDALLITGYSYGGFMTCGLTAHERHGRRWRAAVAGGLVCDLAHLAGASADGILLDTLEFVPGSGRARELSPLEHVDRVTTPTLILHGDADLTCPVGQAEQWHAGLRLAGVESELVVYPGGSHAFVLTGTPSHRLDYSRRLVDWFERHLSPRPATATLETDRWQARLETLIEKYRVPGAVLGIMTTTRSGFDRRTLAAGVARMSTGEKVTPQTLFQIGSITKVWTATLIMQLVDEGLLDLDAPVASILEGFTTGDPDAAATVTVRHLLTHTSGIDGDVFTDAGRGDDVLEKYVATLVSIGHHFPPEADWSYCNTGFALLGRIVEVLRGDTWDRVLRERILQPLDLRRTTTLPEQTVLHPFAVGHAVTPNGASTVAEFVITRSMGPAGLLSAPMDDLLAFAADSLVDEPVLLPRAVHARMLEIQRDISVSSVADTMRLGWLGWDWSGAVVHGHDGGTLGQQAFLRVIPEAGLAIAIAANGGAMGAMASELLADIAAELADIRVPAPFGPPEPALRPALDDAAIVGRYRDAAADIEVIRREGALIAIRTDHVNPSGTAEITTTTEYDLIPAQPGVYAAGIAGKAGWSRVELVENAGCRLHFGTRVFPRVSDV